MTQQDANLLRDSTRVLWGSLVYRVRVGIEHRFEPNGDSELWASQDLCGLRLEFHTPLLPPPERGRKHKRVGSLWINIDNCAVRLQGGDGQVLVNDGDSTAKLLAEWPRMIGSRLIEVTVEPPGGDAHFVFEDGRVVTCFPATRWERNWTVSSE